MQSASDSSLADQPAPPAVRIVIPTRDPGPWFDDVISSLAAQDYPSFAVSIVHASGDDDLLERHRESLPQLEFVSTSDDAGFGEKVNTVAAAAIEPLLLIHHDDVAMEPGALSALVRELLRRRETRTLVAAKLLDWSNPKALMPAGFEADRFGVTASTVKPGDLDQGQQDRVVDLFGSSTACLIVDREFFLSIGGFDEEMDWHGEAHDLALRARSVGGQVVVSSAARARHRGVFEARGGEGSPRRERRHQLRSVLAAAPARSLPWLVVSAAILHVVEFIVAVVRLDVADALAVPGAWAWNVRHIGSLHERRKTLASIETFSGDDLKLIRRRGSIRLSESIDRRISQRELASETGEATISVIRVAGGAVLGALLAFGARHLLTRPIPVVGEFRAVPDDWGTLTADWWSGFRTWGMGSEGFETAALPLLDVLGLVAIGSAALLHALLVIAPIPIGIIGVWKLFSRSASDLAPVAAALLYAASPLPYNAMSGGSLTALVLYALLPWMLSNLIAITQTSAFGESRERLAAAVALSCLIAVLIATMPFLVVILLVILIGIIVGSFLSGDVRGVPGMVTYAGAATVGALLVNLPWLLEFQTWEQFSSAQGTGASAMPLTDLLTLGTGPFRFPLLGWAVFVPALFPLLSGSGQRFTWAMRLWGAMLAAWALAWAGVRGWLPIGMPVLEVLLVPVALGFAALGGLAALVLEVDLKGAKVRRLLPAAAAVIGLVVASVPLLAATSSGRWELARVDLSTTYRALETPPEEGTYRVLWIGDAHVLGAASIRTSNDLAWTSSLDGVPDIRAMWGGLDEGATTALSDVVGAGLEGRTSRLGRQLAPYGVRFIVVMDQQAPVPEASRRSVVSDIRAAGLRGQLDLVSDGVFNPAVTVYRNTAWAPVHSAVAPSALLEGRVDDADPAIVRRDGVTEWAGQTRAERDVYASWNPSQRWVLTVDGSAARRVDLGEVGMGFETSSQNGADARLHYDTSEGHRVVVLLQAAAWILLFAARRWFVGGARRHRRRVAARAERIG